ncbi:MAG: FMN-binding protein [Gammaproteobacteria bacterium]|nr:FMN-binding protein [Gammaproteobacteria bacterium]
MDFLAESFHGEVPESSLLLIDTSLEASVKQILGHRYESQRIRYWREEGRTAWILQEVGKTKPITVGIVVNQGKLERVKVLVFRESRGWEVRYPFFTDQFIGASLTESAELDKTIDGVTGATLSVSALTRLARLAILLHKESEK